MHLGLRQLLIVSVLFACGSVKAAETEPQSSPSGYPYSQSIEDDWKKNNPLISYRERRNTWGALVSVGYSNYSPEDYDPDFVVNQNYGDFYGELDQPMIEGRVSAKFNISIFSLSADLTIGHLQNNGKFGSTLSLTPVQAGGTLALDGIFGEPYLVPYISAGLYSVFYRETLASQKVEGRTTPAPYYATGLRLQLDWIDQSASDQSLMDYGLENTFVFAEGRHFAPSGDLVPDVSSSDDTPYMINAGLCVEF